MNNSDWLLLFFLLIGGILSCVGAIITLHGLNLSVSQLGYFLNLLVSTSTIDISYGQLKELFQWTVDNFQSKKRAAIRPSSLRNKYSVADFDALGFWKNKLKEWSSKVQDDLDRLTK